MCPVVWKRYSQTQRRKRNYRRRLKGRRKVEAQARAMVEQTLKGAGKSRPTQAEVDDELERLRLRQALRGKS